MSEQTRAAYWARLEEINQQIAALEDERDSVVMSEEDREFYRSKHSPLMRELMESYLPRLAVYAGDILRNADIFDAILCDAKIGTKLRIKLPGAI